MKMATSKIECEILFRNLSDELSIDWEKVATRCGLLSSDIEHIKHDNLKLGERSFKFLVDLRNKFPALTVWSGKLLAALRREKRNDLVLNLEEFIRKGSEQECTPPDISKLDDSSQAAASGRSLQPKTSGCKERLCIEKNHQLYERKMESGTKKHSTYRNRLEAAKSVEQRNPSFDGNFEKIKSAEERTTCSQRPTCSDFTLLMKTDFLKSFEWMLEQAKARDIDVVGQSFKIANFAAVIFDCHGGFLSIDDLKVHLYVPPGAIPEGQTQQVYTFVTGSSSVDKHSFSTPLVHCGPPDAVFDKDVVLTMPHCVKDTSSCKISVFKLSSDGSRKLRDGLDVITVVDSNSMTFLVNHFCGFGATASPVEGTILKKYVVACVFIREDSDDEVALCVRLVDGLQVIVEEVIKKEREYGFHLTDMESPMIVQKNGQHVVAKISNFIETWEISEPESCQRIFHHQLLWRETAAPCAQVWPFVVFFAKRCSGSKRVSFKARMTVYQEGSESCDQRVTFLVAEKQGRHLPLVPDQDAHMKLMQQLMVRVKIVQPVHDISRTREDFKILYDILDVYDPLENDWRKLLYLLFETDSGGCSVSIDSISDKAGRERRSPTEIVIDLFYGRQSGKTEEETMSTLKRALFGMNREDVNQLAHRFDKDRPV